MSAAFWEQCFKSSGHCIGCGRLLLQQVLYGLGEEPGMNLDISQQNVLCSTLQWTDNELRSLSQRVNGAENRQVEMLHLFSRFLQNPSLLSQMLQAANKRGNRVGSSKAPGKHPQPLCSLAGGPVGWLPLCVSCINNSYKRRA